MKISTSKFKIALARKQMNVFDLSEKTGVSTNTINSWIREAGKRCPSTKKLGIVSNVLGCDVAELIEE